MSLNSRERLLERINRGPEARARLVESHLGKNLAFQIRALRDREKWSQTELAKKLGMTQNAISRLESPNYGKATLTTLKRLAAVFDVSLSVRFVPFSQFIDWVSGTPYLENGLSSESILPDSFTRDKALRSPHVAAPKKEPRRMSAVAASMGSSLLTYEFLDAESANAEETGYGATLGLLSRGGNISGLTGAITSSGAIRAAELARQKIGGAHAAIRSAAS